MSLLGRDAIGRFALGQIDAGNISMPAVSASFAVSGGGQPFTLAENAAAGSFALSATSISEVIEVAAGSFSLTGAAQTFTITENVGAGSYDITGSVSNNVNGVAESGAFLLTAPDQWIYRTGDDYEFKLGGIGHLLEEIERQKQLNAITRKIPGPVDRRSIPRFEPLRGLSSAPAVPAPDMASVQNQHMAEAAAQARTAKRRRDEEALLLLAS